MMRSMSASPPVAVRVPAKRSNAYEMFIFVLTILSLAIMVELVLPWTSPVTKDLLTTYDNLICIVFLIDFGTRLHREPRKRDYFISRRGWLDLLGSIPSFQASIFQYAALLRLARLSRLARITRLLRGQSKKEIVADIVENRAQYAVYITLISAMVVLVVASVAVLQFESKSADANITTGGQALWWAVVTITTVGYGDYTPITAGGRITAVFVMLMGVGIIGALASILASILVPSPDDTEQDEAVHSELVEIRKELAALRQHRDGT